MTLKYPFTESAATQEENKVQGHKAKVATPDDVSLDDAVALSSTSLCGSQNEETFCSDPTKYPVAAAASVIDKMKIDSQFAIFMDLLQPTSEGVQSSLARHPDAASLPSSSPPDSDGRQGQAAGSSILDDDDGLESPVCGSYWSYVFPKRAMNQNGEYKFILNAPQDGELAQAVRIRVCLRANKPCDLGSYTNFLSDVVGTACRQEFGYIRLLAFSNEPKDNQQPLEVGTFQFPSACSCYFQESI